MNIEIFTTVKLPSGTEATIFDGKGKDFFKALQLSKGDNSIFIKHLFTQLVSINGKKLTLDDIDNMSIRDISYISEIINLMLSNVPISEL